MDARAEPFAERQARIQSTRAVLSRPSSRLSTHLAPTMTFARRRISAYAPERLKQNKLEREGSVVA